MNRDAAFFKARRNLVVVAIAYGISNWLAVRHQFIPGFATFLYWGILAPSLIVIFHLAWLTQNRPRFRKWWTFFAALAAAYILMGLMTCAECIYIWGQI